MRLFSTYRQSFCFIIPFFLLTGIAAADEDSATISGTDSDDYFQLENCITASRIRNTNIVDDRTIIFYMSQRKIYVNHLPRRCAGLKSAGTFSYRLRGSQLCKIDMITVTRSMGGRIDAGPSCGLGSFRPVTEEEVAMLRNKEVEAPPQTPESAGDSDESDSDESDPDASESAKSD